MKRRKGKSLNQEMNLTNMVDVIFSILVVFMITAPLMSQGIKVKLPQTSAPTLKQEKLVRISIDSTRQIFIEDDPVTLQSFHETFHRIWDGKVPVVVNSDEDVPYGLVIKVVGAAQKAGVKKIGFLTLGQSDPQNQTKSESEQK